MLDETTFKWSREALLRHADRLVGRSLADLYPAEALGTVVAKGSIGQLVQRAHFGLPLDNRAEADFARLGVELKVTGATKTQSGQWRAKERLVLSIIDYFGIANESFESSAFVRKNAVLLLIFYMYQAGVSADQIRFLTAGYWELLERDLPQIKRDWQHIARTVRSGRAHHLSEADTLYLGAAVKGAGRGRNLRTQPHSSKPAKQRAFSLKPAYLNYVLDELLGGQETAQSNTEQLTDVDGSRSVEDLVKERLAPFQGMREEEIAARLGVDYSMKEKGRRPRYVRRILGVAGRGDIEEFRRAGIILKTVPLDSWGYPTERMSFKPIDYRAVVEEEWETSELRNTLINKMLLVFFRSSGEGRCKLSDSQCRLDVVRFWQMSEDFLDNEVRAVWEDTVAKIRVGNYADFLTANDTKHVFVNTHGRNRDDLVPTPQGGLEKRRSFWLDRPMTHQIYQQEFN